MTIFWFRRDLRLHDNAALYEALSNHKNVQPIFIFDKNILEKLQNKEDARVEFIHNCITEINLELAKYNSTILTFFDEPINVFAKLIAENNIKKIYVNHDYEPYATARDEEIKLFLSNKNISFLTYKDQCIFEKTEVTKDDGKPYTIFTPYMRKWKQKINSFYLKSYPTEKYFHNFIQANVPAILSLTDIGFKPSNKEIPTKIVNENIVAKYDATRNFPSLKNGTSLLSIHLRFGTVSIRELATKALQLNDVWLNELIWRDFYMMIMYHFPHVINSSFKPQYDKIKWNNNEAEFKKWCTGNTGYPIVDAGMRELNKTGFMHNRVRMIVASFLTKHLLIDWRWGEAYFAEKLNDFDLSANNGGWQWAAGSGCDAAPYFRIFNPAEQTKKFDAKHDYIKRWVPEYNSSKYSQPIVDHKFARERCLKTYKMALNEEFAASNQMEIF